MNLQEIITTLNAIDDAIEELRESTNPLDEWCCFMLWRRKRALEKLQMDIVSPKVSKNVSN